MNFKMIFVILLLFTIFIRIDNINAPIIDAHSWRQSETYSIAKNFLEDFNIMHPRVNYIEPEINKERFFLGAFPVYEYLLASVFRIFGESVLIARFFSILITFLTSIYIWLVCKQLFNEKSAFIAALVFNIFPASIFWGRAVMNDLLALNLSLLAVLLILEKKPHWFAALVLALAISIKPFFLVTLVPIYYLLVLRNYKEKKVFLFVSAIFTLISLSFFSFWTIYKSTFPPHSIYPDSYLPYLFWDKSPFVFLKETKWLEILLNERLFYELTPIGFLLFLAGVFTRFKNNWRFKFLFIWLGSVIFALVFVTQGNVWHTYYQIIIFPIASIIIALVIDNVLSRFSQIKQFKLQIFLILLGIFFLYYLGKVPFDEAKNDYFRQDVKYGYFLPDMQSTKAIIPKNKLVLLADDIDDKGSPVLLHHLDRYGWIIKTDKLCDSSSTLSLLKHYKNLGAEFLMLPNEPYYFVEESCHRNHLRELIKTNYRLVFDGKALSVFSL